PPAAPTGSCSPSPTCAWASGCRTRTLSAGPGHTLIPRRTCGGTIAGGRSRRCCCWPGMRGGTHSGTAARAGGRPPRSAEARLWAHVLDLRERSTQGEGWAHVSKRLRAAVCWRVMQPTLGMLWAEAAGHTSYRATWVNVTDGGHYDNLGLVEALRRGARNI